MTPSFAISSALRDPDQLGSPVYEELVGEEIYWTIDIPSKDKHSYFITYGDETRPNPGSHLFSHKRL